MRHNFGRKRLRLALASIFVLATVSACGGTGPAATGASSSAPNAESQASKGNVGGETSK